MKKLSASSVTNFLFKGVLVLALIVSAGILGVGVAGFIAYRELGDQSAPLKSAHDVALDMPVVTPRLISIPRLSLWHGQQIVMNVPASLATNRFVAANSSDKPGFAYADYHADDDPASGAPVSPVDARSTGSGVAVPPPLEPSAEESTPVASKNVARLTDPGSRYIVDENTGRVIGIDGTAGAAREARLQEEQEQIRRAMDTSRPDRTVRAALPVDSLSSDLPPPKPELYPAVRRALPVADAVPDQPPAFNATAEVADDNQAVLRAQPVLTAPPVRRSQRFFSLP